MAGLGHSSQALESDAVRNFNKWPSNMDVWQKILEPRERKVTQGGRVQSRHSGKLVRE